jgi:hypothetical protein
VALLDGRKGTLPKVAGQAGDPRSDRILSPPWLVDVALPYRATTKVAQPIKVCSLYPQPSEKKNVLALRRMSVDAFLLSRRG